MVSINNIVSNEHYIKGSVAYFGNDVESGTYLLYEEIFRLTQYKYPNIIRCQNYLPKILPDNYNKFNVGRKRAFNKKGYKDRPSALAVDIRKENLTIDFIATNKDIGYISNSRQIDPEFYPAFLGEQPLFSRAVIVDKNMYISGTASIIGYKTTHRNNLLDQLNEIIQNISTLISGQNLELGDLKFTIYVKEDRYIGEIKSNFKHDAIYQVADMCREDLLLEIEAEYEGR
jgi:enamine deaminase RidA (YjgF/YER057c/UK114 family)